MPDEDAAVRTFASLVDEARRWKGRPDRLQEGDARRMAAWPDLEIRQAGRGLLLRVRAPRFEAWWHDPRTWADDPMGSVRSWTLGEPASTWVSVLSSAGTVQP